MQQILPEKLKRGHLDKLLFRLYKDPKEHKHMLLAQEINTRKGILEGNPFSVLNNEGWLHPNNFGMVVLHSNHKPRLFCFGAGNNDRSLCEFDFNE